MEEKNQEEWRGIFTTIELREENILKVKDENDRLKTNFDKLLGRVKQLESSQEKENIKLKNLEEKVKNVEVENVENKTN